ncbi:MAG: NAD(P)-binding domain-containing protein [Solirubrobacteraceae bacterium]|nr:NAD(P)-binding domain-containing protein [Solirubrobacteraceae bacterium]
MSPEPNLRIAIIGAGAIGSLFAFRLARAGQDVTLIVRNPERAAFLREHGVLGRAALTRRVRSAPVGVKPALERDDAYDLVMVCVQRHQFDVLVPALAANRSRQIMLMFNCARGADAWSPELGADRVVWGFPAVLAHVDDGVLRYRILPAVARFLQITVLGRPDGKVTPELDAVRQVFTRAGFPSRYESDIDAWLKTHAALIAPMLALSADLPPKSVGPLFGRNDSRLMAAGIHTALRAVRDSGHRLTPLNMRSLERVPPRVLAMLLRCISTLPVAKQSLRDHGSAAPTETAMLLEELHGLARAGLVDPSALTELSKRLPEAALPVTQAPSRVSV